MGEYCDTGCGLSQHSRIQPITAVTRENRGNHNKRGPFGEAEARIWGAQVKG